MRVENEAVQMVNVLGRIVQAVSSNRQTDR